MGWREREIGQVGGGGASNLVFYAQLTIVVLSGQETDGQTDRQTNECQRETGRERIFVFYALSTITVISGRDRERFQRDEISNCRRVSEEERTCLEGI